MTPVEENVRKRSHEDYIFGKVIGEGSFSTVYLAKDVHTAKEYAIKVLEKAHIIREKKTEYVMREKEVLRLLGSSCRYFVHLFWTFQDTERLYFVLTYAKRGELLQQINKHNMFNLDCTRYYTAELVLALEYLHSKGIIHRDLKPENILFDENYHILITDFGSAKIIKEGNNQMQNGDKQDEGFRKRRNSFVGTAQFVSPEMLNNSESFYASDLWALGCIVYQMSCGKMPFVAGSEYLIFQKILKLKYEFPEDFDVTVRDFVEKLLVLEPTGRLGASDTQRYTSLREHGLFHGIDWDNLGPPPPISDKRDSVPSINDHIIPDHLEPGLDEEKLSRLVLDLMPAANEKSEPSRTSRNITDLSREEIQQRLSIQQGINIYHQFVEGNLILKQGLLDKRKGLFPRRRMFLLTFGPRLFYVDPVAMVLKGEVPWSSELRAEAKNFKTFFIHTVLGACCCLLYHEMSFHCVVPKCRGNYDKNSKLSTFKFLDDPELRKIWIFGFTPSDSSRPNRKYYLEDPEGYALEWIKAIEQVSDFYYTNSRQQPEDQQ